jgi:hypothetical protein
VDRLHLSAADVASHTQRHRHDRQRRVHARRGREHRAVADVEVVDLVHAAEPVADRLCRVGAHARRAHDVCGRRLAHENVRRQQAGVGGDPRRQPQPLDDLLDHLVRQRAALWPSRARVAEADHLLASEGVGADDRRAERPGGAYLAVEQVEVAPDLRIAGDLAESQVAELDRLEELRADRGDAHAAPVEQVASARQIGVGDLGDALAPELLHLGQADAHAVYRLERALEV